MSSNPRDDNRVPVISGVSSSDGQTIVLPYVDPTTHRLLVDSTGLAKVYDLSPYLDGSTTMFTIPANVSIILIVASSAPFVFRPTVDYTGTGTTTLTFTAAVDPASTLAAGQTVIEVYV